jgi:hypothetical protein
MVFSEVSEREGPYSEIWKSEATFHNGLVDDSMNQWNVKSNQLKTVSMMRDPSELIDSLLTPLSSYEDNIIEKSGGDSGVIEWVRDQAGEQGLDAEAKYNALVQSFNETIKANPDDPEERQALLFSLAVIIKEAFALFPESHLVFSKED